MYKVPGLRLVVQHKTMACWYASARMLIQWKRHQARATFADHPDPSQVAVTIAWEVSNAGVTNPQVIQLAQTLGLKTVPPMTPSLKMIRDLLQRHGPLWTNGKSHIVVIGGVDEVMGSVLVFDPWPPGQGTIEWRPFKWYLGGHAPDSRDTSADLRAIFLYHP
jgi:hypothetical protein